MSEMVRKAVPVLWVVPLIAVCFYTGGESSPYRFGFPPLLMLMSLRLPAKAIFLSGAAFSFCYAGMVLSVIPADTYVNASATTEFIFYLLSAWAAAHIARSIALERNQFRLAETNFQGLSNELSTRTMNLQTTLDTLSLVHAKLQNLDRNKTAVGQGYYQ